MSEGKAGRQGLEWLWVHGSLYFHNTPMEGHRLGGLIVGKLANEFGAAVRQDARDNIA